MARRDLTEAERLEIEVLVLREALALEKISHAKTAQRAAEDAAKVAQRDRDMLFLRLMTRYKLEGKKKIKFSPDGTALEYEDDPVVT
jgi:hypothetical protein